MLFISFFKLCRYLCLSKEGNKILNSSDEIGKLLPTAIAGKDSCPAKSLALSDQCGLNNPLHFENTVFVRLSDRLAFQSQGEGGLLISYLNAKELS